MYPPPTMNIYADWLFGGEISNRGSILEKTAKPNHARDPNGGLALSKNQAKPSLVTHTSLLLIINCLKVKMYYLMQENFVNKGNTDKLTFISE